MIYKSTVPVLIGGVITLGFFLSFTGLIWKTVLWFYRNVFKYFIVLILYVYHDQMKSHYYDMAKFLEKIVRDFGVLIQDYLKEDNHDQV